MSIVEGLETAPCTATEGHFEALVSEVLPEVDPVTAPGDVFASPGWLAAWESTTAEEVVERRYLTASRATGPSPVAALSLISDSPFWRGYEQDAHVAPVWNRPVAYLPSLYSFRGPFHRSNVGSAATIVTAARAQAVQWKAQALVLANLDSSTAGRLSADQPGDACIRLDASFSLPLPPTIEGYFSQLKRDHRADLRRRWRRATERGVVLRELVERDALPRLAEFLALANACEVKHGIEPTYDLGTFQALASVPGARLLIAERAGEMLAGFYAFPCGVNLVLWSGGIQYAALHEFSPYVFLLYEVVSLAYEHGWRVIDFGRGNSGFKVRHGCQMSELWMLVYLTDSSDDGVPARLCALDAGLQSAGS
jgi:CelD/BcsL family acetyltransferase involved in cellulose biosynthesis